MRLLITGAQGYVGRHLLARLARRHSVFAVGRTPPERPVDGVTDILWDLREPVPPSLPNRLDGVVHLAQSRHYRHFPAMAQDMLAVNVTAAVRLAEHAVQAGASRFCLVSSGSVLEPFDGPLTEDTPRMPTGFNGASKLAAEILLEPFKVFFPVFAPRLFFPYGPGQTDRLVVSLVERIRRGDPVEVDADGGGPRLSPIYIDDVADILEAGLENAWNGPLNVAGPDAVTLEEVARLAGRLLDRPVQIRPVERRPVNMVPDLSRLAALRPLAGLTGFEAGLRRTLGLPPG